MKQKKKQEQETSLAKKNDTRMEKELTRTDIEMIS